MGNYKVKIPYTDSKLKKKFDVEFIVEAKNENDAIKKAINKFDNYEKNTFASWIREIIEDDIIVEEFI